MFFLIGIFSMSLFNIVDYELDFMIYFDLFSTRLSRFRKQGHGLTLIDSGHFIMSFKNYIFLYNFII